MRWKYECRPLAAQWIQEGSELPVRRLAADPDFAKTRIEFETAQDIRTPESKYGYERAFGVAPVLPPTL
jgi:hypothetical protein